MADSNLVGIATENTAPAGTDLKYVVTGGTTDTKLYSGNDNLLPDGFMLNGKISVTVAANNITVALKTKSGGNPSATDPVSVWINGSFRRCTAALSVTKNAGTQWFALGANFATIEQDFFVYLIWNTTPATDIMDIGFARNPGFRVYSDASGTTTNENYLAYGNASAPTSTDDMVVVWRFAATLSASASYNWSVPTFTNSNSLAVYGPNPETRWLTYTPTWGGFSVNPTSVTARYKRVGGVTYCLLGAATSGTSNATTFTVTLPVLSVSTLYVVCPVIDNGTDQAAGFLKITAATLTADVYKSAFAAFTNANGKRMNIVQFFYDS